MPKIKPVATKDQERKLSDLATMKNEKNINEEEEEEDFTDLEKKYPKRSFIARKVRSLFFNFTAALMVASFLSVVVSVVWLITFLIVSSGFVTELRRESFGSSFKLVQQIYDPPQTVSRTFGSFLNHDFLHNQTSFNKMRGLLEQAARVNRNVFKAGLQLVYLSGHGSVGVKQSNSGDGKMQIFIIWNTPQWRNELPNVNASVGALEYFYYDDFENGIINPKVLFSIPGYTADVLDKGIGVTMLRALPQPKNKEQRETWDYPSIYSCPKEGQTCSFISQFVVSQAENPLDGWVGSTIQLPYIAQLLKNNAGSGFKTALITRSKNHIIGSSVPSVSKYYVWDATQKKHVHMAAATFSDRTIALAVNYLQQKYGTTYSGLSNKTITTNDMWDGLTKYYVDAQIVALPGLDLLYLQIVPEWQFIGTSTTVGIVLFVLSVLMMIVSVLAGLITSFIIYKPLNSFVKNIGQITDGLDLENVNFGSRPYFTEFDDLQSTFVYLVGQLKLYRTFLPEHILKQVDGLDASVDDNTVHSNKDPSVIAGTVSEVGSDHSGTSHHSYVSGMSKRSSAHTNVTADLMALGLKNDYATFITIKLSFKDVHSVAHNMKIFSEILTMVNSVSLTRNGRIESFSDNEIVVGFNSIVAFKNHIQGACNVALKIKIMMEKLSHKSMYDFGMGLSTGLTYMGTIGSRTKRSWQSIGQAVSYSKLLASHALDISTPVLICQDVHRVIGLSKTFQVRVADVLFTTSLSGDGRRVFQLVSLVVNKHDEWFYELQNQEAGTWTQQYVSAMHSLFSGELEEAREMLSGFLESHPEDILGRRAQSVLHYLEEYGMSWEDYCKDVKSRTSLKVGRSHVSFLHHRALNGEE